jgi:hypothetical protein
MDFKDVVGSGWSQNSMKSVKGMECLRGEFSKLVQRWGSGLSLCRKDAKLN